MKTMENLCMMRKIDWEWGKMVVGKVTVLILGTDDSDLPKTVAMKIRQVN